MKEVLNNLKYDSKNNKDTISKILVALLFPVILFVVIQGFFILIKLNFTIQEFNIIQYVAPFLFAVFIIGIGVTIFLSILIYEFIKILLKGEV